MEKIIIYVSLVLSILACIGVYWLVFRVSNLFDFLHENVGHTLTGLKAIKELQEKSK